MGPEKESFVGLSEQIEVGISNEGKNITMFSFLRTLSHDINHNIKMSGYFLTYYLIIIIN